MIEFGGRCQQRVAAVFVLAPLEGIAIAFACSDAHRVIDRCHEDLPVADLAGSRGFRDGLDGLVRDFVRDGHLNSNLGHEINLIFGAPVDLRVALLAAIAYDLGDGHAVDPGARERLSHRSELEWLDDGCNELHEPFSVWIIPGGYAIFALMYNFGKRE